ncbi:acetylxylan esterase [Lacticaseibacillus parakribbianus]|uniref:acetylxylan esterase n=1 Tax=Lacticaseibacillus parakribbianus TaxID=2970927 RepID=UPI0021CB6248|nr:acetylxylan esterase [Lacticaseibacillus parakribbianus]
MIDISEWRDHYFGTGEKPTDFDAFWAQGLAEMNALPQDFTVAPVAIPSRVAQAYDLWFQGVGQARIHCQLILPKPYDPTVKHPGMVMFHGYHCDSGDYQDKFGWAAEGFVCLALDARGQGGLSQDVTRTSGDVMKGLIIRGMEEGPANLYYRSVFLDTAQAAKLLMAYPGVDATRCYAVGASQGGGLAIACASLVPEIYRVQVSYPFLSDYRKAYRMGAQTSAFEEIAYWFQFRDPLHKRESEIFDTLDYIDIHFLAPRIRAEVYWSMGLQDTVVPPQTQFATFNNIQSPKHLVVLPEYGHEYLPKVSDELRGFFIDSDD